MDYFTYLRGMDYSMANQNMTQNYSFMNFGSDLSANTPWPLEFQNKSTQFNLNRLISGVKNSITSERDDEMMYNKLASLAPNEEQKNIIIGIKNDEIVHGKIFRKIFSELTGVMIPENVANQDGDNENAGNNYMDMLKNSFMGELKAIERYRELMAYSPNMEIYNMLLYVLTDEIRHAFKYQYLMMLNK